MMVTGAAVVGTTVLLGAVVATTGAGVGVVVVQPAMTMEPAMRMLTRTNNMRFISSLLIKFG
jgi:hypothetical protein